MYEYLIIGSCIKKKNYHYHCVKGLWDKSEVIHGMNTKSLDHV